jgi:hypothetical protein
VTLLRLCVALGLLLAASALSPPAAAQGVPAPTAAVDRVDPETALLLEARIGAQPLGDGIRAFDVGKGICLDFGDLIGALNIAVTVAPDGRSASGWAFSERNRVSIDRAAARAEFGSHYARIDPGTIWESKSGWCVRSDALGEWLGLGFETDLTNAVLRITSAGTLPIEALAQRAIAAQRLRDLAGAQQPEEALPRIDLPYRMWRFPSIDASVHLGLDRAPNGRTARAIDYEILAAGEVAYFSSEMRIASDHRGVPATLRLKLYRDDPDAGLLGPLHARTIALGDVESLSSPLVAQSVPGRGFALSNRPLGLSGSPDKVDLVGTLPNGWDAELYRNGELLQAIRGSAGRYEFRDIELLYGTNLLEVVRYGPQGQIRRETRAYNIAAQSPRQGEFWWSASAVDGQRDLISLGDRPRFQGGWRYETAFDYGVRPGLSVGGAFHRMRVDQQVHDYVEVNARAGIFGLLGEVNAVRDLDSGAALRARLLGRALGTNIAVEAVVNDHLTSERIAENLRSSMRITLDRPVRVAGGIIPVRFDLARTDAGGEQATRAELRASLSTRRFSLTVIGGWQHQTALGGPGTSQSSAGLLLNTRVGKVRLRGSAGVEFGPKLRFASADLTADLPTGRSGNAQALLGYGDGAGRYGLSYTRDFDRFALTASASGDTRGQLSLGLNLVVSVGRDGSGRFSRFASAPLAQAGSLLVRAFDDRNGDGERQADESWVAVPGLLINDLPVRAAKKGTVDAQSIDDLEAGVPVKVALDRSAIADPFSIPSRRGAIATPRAGVSAPIALGIMGTGTIEGVLMAGETPAAGQRLALVGADGKVAAHARSEFDGVFSFEQVPYGRYALRVEASAGPPLAEIVLSYDQPMRRLGKLSLATPHPDAPQ